MEPDTVSIGHCLCGLAFAYSFPSANNLEKLDKTNPQMGKQWKHFLSNEKSMKHFYKF